MTSSTTRTRADPRSISPRNPQVIKLMQSFTSKELVKEQFSWRYYYWYLTNEGIEYLRDFLNLPDEVVPATLNKPAAKPARADGQGYEGEHRGPLEAMELQTHCERCRDEYNRGRAVAQERVRNQRQPSPQRPPEQ